MDDFIKIKKNERDKCVLSLKTYANGYHATALKVVHFLNEWEEGVSHTRIHTHNFYELVVVLRGKGKHLINGQRLAIRSGSVFLLCPGEYHCYEYSETLVLLTFMFDSRILRPFRTALARLPGYGQLFSKTIPKAELLVDPTTIAELDIQLNAIAAETRQSVPGGELLLASYLINALVLILRNTQRDECFTHVNGDIGIAVSFMQRHFHEEIQLSHLARQANLSESTFYRKFHNEFGMAPMQWLLKLRIRKAMEFLIRSDMTIAEIAMATGFSDPLYFSRQFRKVTGMGPRRYRTEEHGPLQIVHGLQTFMEDRKI